MSAASVLEPVAELSQPAKPAKRERNLNDNEKRVAAWVLENYGTLSEIAREFEVSVPFVYHIAYFRGGRKSRGLRIEHRLKSLGCPLIQKIR